MEPLISPAISAAAAKYGVLAAAAGAFIGLAQTDEKLTFWRAIVALGISFLTGVYSGPVLSLAIAIGLRHMGIKDFNDSHITVIFSFSVWFTSLVALRVVPVLIATVVSIVRKPFSFWKGE